MRTSGIPFVLCLVLLAVLCSCSDFSANTTGKMHVLAIGLSYKNTGASELMGPVNDATEFCGAMDGILNAKSVPRKILCMLQEGDSDDPTDRMYPDDTNVRAAVKALNAAPNDMVLIYYSGHGQDAWWARCPVCGTETRIIADGSDKPEGMVCEYCNDAITVLGNLTYLSAMSGSAISDASAAWKNGTISDDEYASVLESDGSAEAKEILSMRTWFSRKDAPLLGFSARGFFVTAPEQPVPLQEWASQYSGNGTLFGAIAGKMATDALMPDIGNYRNNIAGYYTAVSERLGYYGLSASDMQAFNRYWNIFARDVWPRQNWTEIYMDEFVDELEALSCRVLLIADCCYSGFAEDGRDHETVSFGRAFTEMFSKREPGNVTVVTASALDQTSLDSYASTEDGGAERHGLFTISLLEELGWVHSLTRTTYVGMNGSVRQVNGYLGSVPERKTVRQAMDGIRESWSYMNQTPLINATYLDTVLVP